MITHISSLNQFDEQLAFVINEYTPHSLKAENFDHVILGGLGGSGIGAVIAKNWFFDQFPRPIECISDYYLPKYVSEKSLVVLNSYSGNTEETLQMFEEAKAMNARIVVLTSGGKIGELADAYSLKKYTIPTGYQPRMTIGFGLSYLVLILGELMGQDLKPELNQINEKMIENRDRMKHSAQTFFNFFKNNLKNKFVVNADRFFTPVAIRFCQQLQENAKLEGFVHTLPEANHNVIESYTDRLPSNFVMLYNEESERTAARFDFLISYLELDNNRVLPMVVPAFTLYAIYDLIYRLDWVSVYFAEELGAPMMEVPIITQLKEHLSNIGKVE